MITRAQVADLQPGDVVELSRPDVPGVRASAPAVEVSPGRLYVGIFLVRWETGDVPANVRDYTLTVVSRAPRPLYANHPRTELVVGDVVQDASSVRPHHFVYSPTEQWIGAPWLYFQDGRSVREMPRRMPARLRLLVDGSTGETVPGQPAGDPLAHISKGDPTPEGADENPTCGAMSRDWACTRKPDHVGQHIAGCGIGNSVAAVWS